MLKSQIIFKRKLNNYSYLSDTPDKKELKIHYEFPSDKGNTDVHIIVHYQTGLHNAL